MQIPELTDIDLRQMLEHMIEARLASQRAFNLQRQGRAGTSAPVDGSEALVVGAARALDPATDWVVPQYRELVGLRRYGTEVLDRYLLYLRGHPGGGHLPEPIKVFPVSISLATQIPHAAGLAWAQQLDGRGGVTLVFFGDGSSSEGDFYEAINLAGVRALPVIFCCVNNGWAISTPVSRQTGAEQLVDKAAAAGIAGVRVDGTDPVAVYEVVAAARARAAAGQGPTLIEAVTYRLAHHTTADDPTRYVPPDELEHWKAKDPLVTFPRRLVELGLWDEATHSEAEATARARIDDAQSWAEAQPLAPDAFFDHVQTELSPRQRRQRVELVRRTDSVTP